ncbi:fatty acyl-CoA reductase 1 [Lolium perenne]|uniref:fatty acyl-CoA reductase 1 n=1 Tax=Lolium perenne TaxID=4522 RepID=UPI0021F61569|nr:fatty acyl-CoA reductase 1-like [Lolium perenne]
MDTGMVTECFRNKTILITGSTGFLGKLLLEKILRVQPDVKKIYLLVRAPDDASAEQRIICQVLGKDLFNTLREKHGLSGFQELIKEKIVSLAGDVGTRDFGLDSSRMEDLCEEIDIIIHGAATTSFYERYDVALATNALGAQYGCEFAKKCPNLKLLLHVSTAFVAGTQEGLLLEKALQIGEALRPGYHLDIDAELQLVEKVKTELTAAKSGSSDQYEKTTMKELGLKRASHFGWPNVYTFTKAMGEMLLEQKREDLPVVIIRPTMVTSTYQDPFPGWIEGARTIDALIVAYDEQAFPCFLGDLKDTMDAVPADMVVNATLVAGAVHWNEKGQVIYHVSLALQNPLSGYVFEDACWDYFSIHPRVLENGKPLQNRRPYLFKKLVYFRAYLTLMYKLPLEMLHAVSLLFRGLFSQYYQKHNRRYTFLMLLVKVYSPYAFFKGCFDDTNLTRLRKEVKTEGNDGSLFNFDPKSMDWHQYLLNIHVPAVLKYSRKKKGSV